MFSMKYTSPKLTPKKARESSSSVLHHHLLSPHPPHPSPSPLSVALDPPSPSLPLASLNCVDEDVDSATPLLVHRNDGNATTSRIASDKTNISNGDDETVNANATPQSKVESSKIMDNVTSLLIAETNHKITRASQLPTSSSTSLVADITLSSNNHTEEHPDENDDSGDGCQVHHDLHGRLSADDSNDFLTREDVAQKQHHDHDDEVDFDSMNYSADRLDSTHNYLSSSHLSDIIHSLPKSTMMASHYFGYQRSISMEPMLHALPADETTASSAAESSSSSSLSRMTSRELTEHNNAQFALDDDNTNPISPMVYDLSARPIDASTTMTPGHDPTSVVGSPHSGTTESDIVGGDAYFDEPFLFRHNRKYEIKPRSDSIVDEDTMLPPRVNRTTTTTTDYATNNHNISMPFLPGCFPSESESSPIPVDRMPLEPYPIPPPRQPFSHTHSLLDDCSDDEDDAASSFFMVDSPTRHHNARTYFSCFPQSTVRGDNSVIEYKIQPSIIHPTNGISNASLKASNNIQQALLQTRHRRWDCQSTLAGSHAQSKEILDISNRCYCVARYHSDNTDGITSSVGLSVSVEAIRAAVLASGLWRTVRCVRLPQGLFWSQMHESDDIWALLRMLNSTFPNLIQIDFSGEIEFAGTSRRNEIVSRIMECLPRIVAIDGFVVEQLVVGSECHSAKRSSSKSDEGEESMTEDTNNNVDNRQSETSGAIYNAAQACGECEPVPMCGLSDLVDGEALNGILDADLMDNESFASRSWVTNRSESLKISQAEKRVDITNVSSSYEHEDRLDKKESLKHEQCPTRNEEHSDKRMIEDCSSVNFSDDEVSKVLPHISSSSVTLSSSLSWGSNGSVGKGSRPPPCPNSASMHRQHPRLPTMPKGSSSIRKVGNRLKRRVLGLIPTVSIMDEDEEDDDENSEGSDNSMDADRHADIL